VVDRLSAPTRSLEHDLEVLGQLRLTEELLEPPGSQAGLVGDLDRIGQRLCLAHG